MLKKKLNIPTKYEKNRTKPGNPYYLVLFENRTKLGTVLSETVLSGDSLYKVCCLQMLKQYFDCTLCNASVAQWESFRQKKSHFFAFWKAPGSNPG